MNIGVVTPQLTNYGGSEIYLLECIRRWQNLADITVYSPYFKRKLFSEFNIGPRVKFERLPSPPRVPERFRLLSEILFATRAWEQHIKRHDIYFLYLYPTNFIQRRPSVWFAAEPLRMIYDLRNYSEQQQQKHQQRIPVHFYPKPYYHNMRMSELEITLNLIERVDKTINVATKVDRLVTNSKTMGGYLENVYGRKPDGVVYPGMNLPASTDVPPTLDKIFCIGRLWEHKRVDLAMKGFALSGSSQEFVIAGDGPERKKLEKLSKKLGISKQVTFLKNVTMGERDRLFHESLCCLYTPVHEPFGMVPLEAAAAARTTICTRGGGFSEILDEDAAYYVPPYEESIAEALQDLISNPTKAIEMGKVGRKTVEPYTWDRAATDLMTVFEETASTKAGKKYGSLPLKSNQINTLLGAYYFVWYQAGKSPQHWNENQKYSSVSDFPLGGPYTSSSPATIRKHLKMMEQAGLDFLVVNLQVDHDGLNQLEIKAMDTLFQIVEKQKQPIKLSIMFSCVAEDWEVFRKAYAFVKDRYFKSPVYLQHQRKCVLWYYVSETFLRHIFFNFKDLESLNRGMHRIAAGPIAYNRFLPELLKEFFSSWTIFSPLEIKPKSSWQTVWSEAYREFVEDDGAMRTFTLSPGYDDRHLLSDERLNKGHQVASRNGLKTFEQMQNATLEFAPPPHYVVINSFNEFHENTHIQSSEQFGDAFIKSTREFKEKLVVPRVQQSKKPGKARSAV